MAKRNANNNAQATNNSNKAAKANGNQAKGANVMRNANNGNRGNQGYHGYQGQGNNGGYAPWQGRTFQVVNTEGEVYHIDTSDPKSCFYGPAWTNVLEAKERGQFLRGYPTFRRVDQADRFSGYSVDIDGVTAFLPASKAGYYHNPLCDACRKGIALKLDTVYPNGPKAGTLIVNARSALNFVLNRQDPQLFRPGSAAVALAVDYFPDTLILQGPEYLIYAPMHMAQQLAANMGLSYRPEDLTGYRWGIGIDNFGPQGCYATPLSILPW